MLRRFSQCNVPAGRSRPWCSWSCPLLCSAESVPGLPPAAFSSMQPGPLVSSTRAAETFTLSHTLPHPAGGLPSMQSGPFSAPRIPTTTSPSSTPASSPCRGSSTASTRASAFSLAAWTRANLGLTGSRMARWVTTLASRQSDPSLGVQGCSLASAQPVSDVTWVPGRPR